MGSRSEPCETKEKGSRAARSATHLQCELVLAQVDGVSLLELAAEVLEQADVEIFAAEEGVAVGRLHLEHAARQLEDRDIERAASQIIHRHNLAVAVALPEAVRQRRRGRLVDDPLHVQARDLTSVARRLPLRVVEVSRDRHDRSVDGAPEERL